MVTVLNIPAREADDEEMSQQDDEEYELGETSRGKRRGKSRRRGAMFEDQDEFGGSSSHQLTAAGSLAEMGGGRIHGQLLMGTGQEGMDAAATAAAAAVAAGRRGSGLEEIPADAAAAALVAGRSGVPSRGAGSEAGGTEDEAPMTLRVQIALNERLSSRGLKSSTRRV